MKSEKGWALLGVCCGMISLGYLRSCHFVFTNRNLTLMTISIMISYDDVKFTADVSKEEYKANKLS